jgi:hypothetical protein
MDLSPEVVFILFTFIIIIIILVVVKDFKEAALIIIVLTNFLVISSVMISINKKTKWSDSVRTFLNNFKKIEEDIDEGISDDDNSDYLDLIGNIDRENFSVNPPRIETDVYASYPYAVDMNPYEDQEKTRLNSGPAFKSSTRDKYVLDDETLMTAIKRDGPGVAFAPGDFNCKAIPNQPSGTAYPYDMDNLFSPTPSSNPCYDEELFGDYMDGDEMATLQQRTQRNDARRPTVGRIFADKNYFRQYFEEELAQAQNRPWWGRSEY